MNFDHILNWNLLKGSHDFPGPDGGTCINEAAVVAAGFEYRSVCSPKDCPPCFSRVIAAYAIALNDGMDTATRQRLLLPFVTRLAGTVDTQEIELARTTHIVIQTIKRVLPIAMRAANLHEHCGKCAAVKTLSEAKDAAADAADAAAYAAAYAANAAASAAASAATSAAYAADVAAYANAAADASAHAAYAAARAADASAHAKIWREATAILDEAINLGNQPDQFDMALVSRRMESAKQLAAIEK